MEAQSKGKGSPEAQSGSEGDGEFGGASRQWPSVVLVPCLRLHFIQTGLNITGPSPHGDLHRGSDQKGFLLGFQLSLHKLIHHMTT